MIQAEPSATATAGVPFATQPVVYEEDQYGNLETGDNSTIVTVSLGNGTGSLQGTTTARVTGGVATFTNLADDTAESISLQFTGGGLAVGPSSNITVTPAAASELIVQTQPSTTATAGQPFVTQPVIYEEDQYGNLETGDFRTVVTVSLQSGGGLLTGKTASTVSGGIATFTGLAEDMLGNITLAFSAAGLSPSPSKPISIAAGPAVQLAITTPPPNPVVSGQAFAMVVAAEDEFDNLANTYDGRVTISLPGDPSFMASVQAQNGVATFAGLTLPVSASGADDRGVGHRSCWAVDQPLNRGHPDADSNADANSNADADADANSNSNPDAGADANSNSNAHTDANSHTDDDATGPDRRARRGLDNAEEEQEGQADGQACLRRLLRAVQRSHERSDGGQPGCLPGIRQGGQARQKVGCHLAEAGGFLGFVQRGQR